MVDDAFGHWFAGFTDGEGSFGIHRRTSGRAETKFLLTLRDDDRAILETLRERLGIGAIYCDSSALARSRGKNARDCVKYQVHALFEKVQLVAFFDQHPLQTKKRSDYLVWREAVLAEAGGESTRDLVRFIQPLRDARAYGPAQAGPTLEIPEEAFGHWFAGFTDAEGCLSAHRRTGGRMETRFRLSLRDDDRAVLETIRERLRVGRIHCSSRALARSRGGKDRDAVAYEVYALPEKVQLVEFFDRYPLQTKKRNDNTIWRAAVLAEANGEPTRDLVRFIQPLRDVRAYRAPAAG